MGMKEQSLSTTGFELASKRARKREFLDDMNLVRPWAALVGLNSPYVPAGKTVRSPFVVETMVRIDFMQQWLGQQTRPWGDGV
jgi:IS5 family transposase